MEKKIKVLIVEDEAIVGLSLKNMLKKLGYCCAGVAVTGEEAINIALTKKPDIILMDIHIIGDMDGIEASERINKNLSIPVIYLTAYDDDKSIERCINTAPYGFLTKPAGQQEIKAAIEIAVNRHRALKAEESIKKKESILKAVAFATEAFLSGNTFEEGLKETFIELGKIPGFERLSLFKKGYDEEKRPVMECFIEWNSESGINESINKKRIYYSDLPYRFEEDLKNNKFISKGKDSVFIKRDDFINSRLIESVLIVPVFSGDFWPGFLSFETSKKSDEWSQGEKEGLFTAGKIISSAILNEKLNIDLRFKEEKYHSLYNLLRIMCDNVPDMIWAKDTSGRYTFVNRTFCNDALKMNDTNLPLGKDIEYLIEFLKDKNPDNPMIDVFEQRIKEYPLKDGLFEGPHQDVYEIKKDDTDIYYDLYEAPYCDDKKTILGTVGCGRNITKEKVYENSLLKITARFTAFMDKLPACAYIRGLKGDILYANRYTKDVFGLDNYNLLSIPEIFGEKDSGVLEDINRRIAENGFLETESTFILGDKKTHTFQFILFPITGCEFYDAIGAIAVDITKAKESELNLFESEQKYRILFENASDAIYVGDEKICTDCNTKMSTLLGYSKDEITGACIADFSPEFQPDGSRSEDKLNDYVERSISGEDIGTFDWQFVKKTNEYIDTRISLSSVVTTGHIHTFLIIRDITEEKKTEQELRKSEERYRSLVDNSPIGIEIFQDGQLVYINPSIEKIVSMSREELMKKDFSELVCKKDYEFIMESNKRRRAGLKAADNYKVRVIDKYKNIRVVDVHVVLIEWNKKPATLNFLTDITEKEKFDEAIRESEERYRSVVENSKINILIAQDEKICYANPSTARFLGLSNEELASRNFLDFIFEDDRKKVLENHRLRLSEKIDEPPPENYTIRAYNSNGDLRILDFNTTVIKWNRRPATLNFLIDITDKIESTKLIEKALDEKTILLQEVHHRVKNNLALINSLLSMQVRTSSSEEVAESLRDAETRIYSIAAVHEGLYKSVSISSIPAEAHFISLAEQIIGNYSPDFRINLDVCAKNCELGLNVAIPISLVVNELITNSIKYAFKGREKGRVYIRMNCGSDKTTLVVGDDGVGIPKDFDPLKTESLGMTLIRNIITLQLEGSVKLSRNAGTKWIIELPRI